MVASVPLCSTACYEPLRFWRPEFTICILSLLRVPHGTPQEANEDPPGGGRLALQRLLQLVYGLDQVLQPLVDPNRHRAVHTGSI